MTEIHPGEAIRTTELVGRYGLTYRKIEHWLSAGVIGDGPYRPGSGNPRSLTVEQARRILLIGRLTEAGLTLGAAAEYAQHADRHDTILTRTLAPGVTLIVRREESP